MTAKPIHKILMALSLLLGACQEPGPIELLDDEINRNELEIINTPPPALAGLDGTDVDSTLPALITERAFGQLVLAGSLYESADERQETILARGIFFTRDAPLISGNDTLYRSLDAGNLEVDGIRMAKILKYSPRSRIDTLGVQYVLGGRDGIGGRGLRYKAGYQYSWNASGAGSIVPFSISVRAVDTIRVQSPTVRDVISARRNLPITWTGGSSSILILISEFRNSLKPSPLLRMRVKVNRGGVVIPSAVLQLLPRDRTHFLFSFVSEKHGLASIGGFRDDVLVQTAYSHNLLLTVVR